MNFEQQLNKGRLVTVSISNRTKARLAKTCFRGIDLRLAGNFSQWDSVESLFADERIRGHFLAKTKALWNPAASSKPQTHRFSIYTDNMIGWDSTDQASKYDRAELRPYSPSKTSVIMRVDPKRYDLKAPRTNVITFVVRCFSHPNKIAISVLSIYPGHDIGPLQGNITAREGRVMFDWEHPGAVGHHWMKTIAA